LRNIRHGLVTGIHTMKNLLLLFCCVFAYSQAPQTGTTPVAPGSSLLSGTPQQKVMVLFTATDAQGAPVSGITKERISIVDNDSSASVTELRAIDEVPIDVGFVLSAGKEFAQQQNAAIALVHNLRPGKDRAFVLVAGGTKQATEASVDWISDPEQLIKTIKDLDKNTGVVDPFQFKLARDSAGLERSAIQEYSSGTFSFFDIAWNVFNREVRPSRRALVIFRSPMGHAPGLSQLVQDYASKRQQHVVMGSQVFRTPIYVVGIEDESLYVAGPKDIGETHIPFDSGTGDAAGARGYDRDAQKVVERQYQAGKTSLDQIADLSGGKSWWSSKKNYSDVVSAIANQFSAAYVLTFTPAVASEAHVLKVTLHTPDHIAIQKAVFQPIPK
jgi:VWFA-related protein